MSEDEYQGRVLIYSIIGCPHCLRAKHSLKDNNIPFIDISVDQYDAKVRTELFERTHLKTVPQIFFNEEFIGGNENLQKLLQSKEELEKKLEKLKKQKPGSGAPSPPDASLRLKDADDTDWSCEPDEYAILVHEMRKAGLIGSNRKLLTNYTNSFVGRNFVKWLIEKKELDHDRAMEMGQMLVSEHFGHAVRGANDTFRDDDTIYRLLEDDPSAALNAGPLSECQPRAAGQLGEELRRLILKVFSASVSEDGRSVNYQILGGSEDFKKYVRLTRELHRVDVASASREEKLAFFINVYNALVIHATVVKGPPSNLFQRWKFFNTMRYIIGGQEYNLQDIENGVLRANRKGVAQLFRPFRDKDPRMKVALVQHEPLIHFALNCGAKSCPPIKTFSAANIMEELDTACKAFLETDDAVKVDDKRNEVSVSKIFDWYRVDFGMNNFEMVQWIEKHMDDGEKRKSLQCVLQTEKMKVSFLKYDWGVNSK